MKKLKLDTNIIPYVVAVAQGLQVGHAGWIYLGVFGAVLGGVLGLAITLSVANASSRISEISQKRKGLARAGLISLLLFSPAAVFPAAYQSFQIGVEWMLVLASIVWAFAPDACMVLSGAIAGKALVQVDVQTQTTQTLPVACTHGAKLQRCELCGVQYRSKGAHMRQNHAELCKQKQPAEVTRG
jgi:hypothetical protein